MTTTMSSTDSVNQCVREGVGKWDKGGGASHMWVGACEKSQIKPHLGGEAGKAGVRSPCPVEKKQQQRQQFQE